MKSGYALPDTVSDNLPNRLVPYPIQLPYFPKRKHATRVEASDLRYLVNSQLVLARPIAALSVFIGVVVGSISKIKMIGVAARRVIAAMEHALIARVFAFIDKHRYSWNAILKKAESYNSVALGIFLTFPMPAIILGRYFDVSVESRNLLIRWMRDRLTLGIRHLISFVDRALFASRELEFTRGFLIIPGSAS